MAAQQWCSGPVHVFTTPGGYLGTCENAPRWHIRPVFNNVMNDLGGVILPFDVQYEGHEGFVTARFTRWNYTNMLVVEAFGSSQGAGIDKYGSMGQFADLEGGVSMSVTLTYPYKSKAAQSGQPAGIHFLLCTVEDYASQLGTGTNAIDVTWHVRRVYSNGDWKVFDHDVGGLPPVE